MGTAQKTGIRIDAFDESIHQSYLLLDAIAAELGWNGRRRHAFEALYVVLHAVRDRLPTVQAAQIGSRLPMLVRGLYYDSWQPVDRPSPVSREEWLDSIRSQFPIAMKETAAELVRGVLAGLAAQTDPALPSDIKKILPADLAGVCADTDS